MMHENRDSNCPHIRSQQHATLLEIKNIGVRNQVKSCSNCDYAGPNLWICLQRNCFLVGCSEQANDHSTEHFHRKRTHCVHMNMSSYRTWCYLCEREVFLDINHNAQKSGEFSTVNKTIRTNESLAKDISDNQVDEIPHKIVGLKGLQNIANTCYMNSALQALSNVQPMTQYFLHCSDLIEHILEQGSHRNKAGLAKSYQRLIKDIWSKGGKDKDYIAPRGILYGIRSVHPMFRGFQQHDTQEFLRCFMDQLHEELKENCPISPLLISQRSRHTLSPDDNSEDNFSQSSSSSSRSCSSSLSESDYETCDSGVSDQSGMVRGNYANSRNATLSGRRLHKINASISTEIGSHAQTQTPQTQVHSIIGDIFDGKLLSSVQCLTCDRISTREETFQDLSLPIPNRDYLNVLHQTHSLSAQSLNSIDSPPRSGANSGAGEPGWISWIWNVIRSWLWGPSVTLYDCMASFFSADELKGDNMYSCEKCNKLRTGIKYSQVLELPEVLCIHLKRFRHDILYSSKISSYVNFPLEGFDMRPYLHRDCKSNVSFYNLVSVICHHGTVGGGHYTCFAQNSLTNRWYEFDDQRVTEVTAETVQNSQAYVLFYRKHNPQMELIRVEASDVSESNPVHMSDIRFYVSREWLTRFNTFAEPGPINNWAILCPHGGLLQTKIALLDQIAIPISQPLWDFLYCKFGGGPAINMLFECDVCKQAAEELAQRQNYEYAQFTKYKDMDENLESSAIFAISMPWLRKWQQFVRGLTCKEPGPITNANIAMTTTDALQSISSILSVRPGSDYAQLSAQLWCFLHGIYGGGPEIILRGSLTEEIELDDDDDEHGGECDSGGENLILSDTESNICQYSMPELSNDFVEKTNIDESRDIKKIILKNSKHAKGIINRKKVKAISLRNSIRNKTMKRGNAMRNADFFGPKGKYYEHKECDADDDKNSPIQRIEPSPSFHVENLFEQHSGAFNKKSQKSFQSEQIKNKNQCDENVDNIKSVEKDYTSRSKRKKHKSINRRNTSLQKFSQIIGSSESAEADA